MNIPKLILDYKDFKEVYKTRSYKAFEATHRKSGAIHLIRVLDSPKEFVLNSYHLAAKLFMQELHHLHSIQPNAVFINSLDVSKKHQQIAYASLPYYPLSYLLDKQNQTFNLSDSNIINKMIRDVASDVEFFERKFHCKNVLNILDADSIYFMRDRTAFFIGNWTKIIQAEPKKNSDASLIFSTVVKKEKEVALQILYDKIKTLVYGMFNLENVNDSSLNYNRIFRNSKCAEKIELKDPSKDLQKMHQPKEKMIHSDSQIMFPLAKPGDIRSDFNKKVETATVNNEKSKVKNKNGNLLYSLNKMTGKRSLTCQIVNLN